MIPLVAASVITLTAMQASVNAPREAFKTCLKETADKATGSKVPGEAYEAFVRANCGGQLTSFKAAVVKFDISNKMSKKSSDEDADAMIGDFVASAVDHYKYMAGSAAPAKQEAVAKATPATPPPTPAAVTQPPK